MAEERSKFLAVDGGRVFDLLLLGMRAEHMRQIEADIEKPSMTIRFVLSTLVEMGLITRHEDESVRLANSESAFRTRILRFCGVSIRKQPVTTRGQTTLFWCGAKELNFVQLMRSNTIWVLPKGLEEAEKLQAAYPEFSELMFRSLADKLDPAMIAGKKQKK